MRRLMLLRHAKADRPSGIGDHERPLTDRGRTDSARMGAYMAAAGLVPDLAIVSSARRAQETWTLARPAFAADIVQRDDRRIYEASAAAIAKAIGETGAETSSLLLVGHNPGFHQLALELVGGGYPACLARLSREYPTAGLVVLDFEARSWGGVSHGKGRLQRFVTPSSIGDVPEAE
jgi:phosphohistidine phosphatase